MSLKNTIESLAQTFADGVLRAIRDANLEEILAESGGRPTPSRSAPRQTASAPAPKRRGGRLARRSPEEVGKVVEMIVGALKGVRSGMRSEELQRALSIDKKEITRPIAEALQAKKIRKTGQKRSTTYFAR